VFNEDGPASTRFRWRYACTRSGAGKSAAMLAEREEISLGLGGTGEFEEGRAEKLVPPGCRLPRLVPLYAALCRRMPVVSA
jgi:hypothetical protein